MRILITAIPQTTIMYIINGYINAFNDIGCCAKLWNRRLGYYKLEIMKEFNPDLVIYIAGEPNTYHRYKIPNVKNINSKVKLAIFVYPFGDKLDHNCRCRRIPLINESSESIKWIRDQKPDCVFGYGCADDSNTFYKNWFDICPFIGLPTAGDSTIYYPDKKDVPYKAAYLGGRWRYKDVKLRNWLFPVIDELKDDIEVRGFRWPKGILECDDFGRSFLSSALVCPCVCEPHTDVYGMDIPERFWKVALCESLPILDNIPNFNRYCYNFIMGNNPKEYLDLIKKYAYHDVDYGKAMAKVIRREVLMKHTYHHRMRDLCNCLGLSDIVKKFDKKIKECVI